MGTARCGRWGLNPSGRNRTGMCKAHTPGGPAEADHRLWELPRDSPLPREKPPTDARPPKWTMHSNPPPLRKEARQWSPRLGPTPECALAWHIPRGELAGPSTLTGPVATPPRSAHVRREAERGLPAPSLSIQGSPQWKEGRSGQLNRGTLIITPPKITK